MCNADGMGGALLQMINRLDRAATAGMVWKLGLEARCGDCIVRNTA